VNLQVQMRKTNALLDCISEQFDIDVNSALVVGCGSGLEAGVIAKRYSASTLGIDISSERFNSDLACPASLKVMDAQQLSLRDNDIDFVFSFHALEHISVPQRALSEMARVLRPGGVFCVGTPNKHRLLGYVGSDTTFAKKVSWNMADWKKRILGEWENEMGAHAGFTSGVLKQLCINAFGSAHLISDQYYTRLGGRTAKIASFFSMLGISKFLYPCVYICGNNRK